MAGLDDLLTATKNIVTALNNYTQTNLSINGATNTPNMTVATVVKTSPGRLASVAVIATGANAGKCYDATSTSVTTAPIFTIPATVGVYVVNFPTNTGLVVAPGSGQTVSVSWS